MHVAIESLQDSRMTTSEGVGRLEAYLRPAPVAPGKARLSSAHGGRPSWIGPFPPTAYASTALRVKRCPAYNRSLQQPPPTSPSPFGTHCRAKTGREGSSWEPQSLVIRCWTLVRCGNPASLTRLMDHTDQCQITLGVRVFPFSSAQHLMDLTRRSQGRVDYEDT
ncbi:hypothetical protein D7B24_006411 [Verticillium nonalfalfae]|uniref:Uncharacterized protein n=1 Tax=Verticillium nonalfalfae TaxID=1051616 RepID=A0A3M9YAI3_9PEZI|nr:uncharacterized protein D7B24_006411 [Verticillium nonalfalfae]RNJ57135.1 hypothetical protein D7B24_006411 [Verticillium nonalfalfae]